MRTDIPAYLRPRPRRQKPTRLERATGINPNKLGRTVWHSTLCCGVLSFLYDFATCTATIYVADGHCVDMTGAIDMATGLDDRCRRIETFSGAERDTCYELENGEWCAIGPAELRGAH